jgi:hypothetical protein
MNCIRRKSDLIGPGEKRYLNSDGNIQAFMALLKMGSHPLAKAGIMGYQREREKDNSVVK